MNNFDSETHHEKSKNSSTTHHEGRTGEDEGGEGIEIGGLLEHPDLLMSDGEHLLLEGGLPRVQL